VHSASEEKITLRLRLLFKESRPERRRGLQICCWRGGGRRSRWEESGPLTPASFGGAVIARGRSVRRLSSASFDAPHHARGGTQCVKGAGLAGELSSWTQLRSIHLKSKRRGGFVLACAIHICCSSTRLVRTRREVINREPGASCAACASARRRGRSDRLRMRVVSD